MGDEQNQTQKEGEKQENQTTETSQPENFEVWLEKQDDSIKKLYTEHISGLKNTVAATRTERDTLKGEVREALKKAEKGSELEKTLTETMTKLEIAERKANFIEDAVKPEIGCRNPKVAYALAVSEDLFTKSGNPDWNAIKASAPELFGKPVPKGSAGEGTDAPPTKIDMNAMIRQKAGVQ